MNLYVCGLDTSERTIYGSIIETDGGQTVKQFCSPNDLHSVSRELDAFLLNDRRPKDLTLCAPDYSLDVQQILEPLDRVQTTDCDQNQGVIGDMESPPDLGQRPRRCPIWRRRR